MKGRVIALDSWQGEKAAALIVDGRLQDFLLDSPPDAPPVPGTVFRAVADRPMKGQGGVFVRLPEKDSGFLRAKDTVRPGSAILVQVTGYAEPGKAVPVTSKLLFKGRFAIVTPGAGGVSISRRIKDEAVREGLQAIAAQAELGAFGAILRSSAATGGEEEILAELQELVELASAVLEDAEGAVERLLDGPDAHHLAWRDWDGTDQWDEQPGAFARHGIDDMIDQVRQPRIELGGGASAWIEPTRALIAVDVNTGGDTSPAAGLKANIALSRDLARQLRCRGLGGQIVIDFAPMPKRDRKQVEQALRQGFKDDGIETALVGWTPLGHFELQRKRDRYAAV